MTSSCRSQRLLGTTYVWIVSKLTTCVCSGFCINVPAHCIPDLHPPPIILRSEVTPPFPRASLGWNNKKTRVHTLRFSFVLHSFCNTEKQVCLFSKIFFFFSHFIPRTFPPFQKNVLFSPSAFPAALKGRTWKQKWSDCVYQCYSMTTSHSLDVEFDTASITHPDIKYPM